MHDAVDPVRDLAHRLRGLRFAVLTGAGISTDSGIPDYRSPGAPKRNPMTFQQFTGSDTFRTRYWARNHLGWRHMDAARPNSGHRALAALEAAGLITGVITQNVDMLHIKACSRRVVDLHGSYTKVLCLGCGEHTTRHRLDERLQALNPGFTERVGARGAIEVAPDADAVVPDDARFAVATCEACGGTLKPDIVYFGQTVPRERVEAGLAFVAEADALVVAGSSLAVDSGMRFVRAARKRELPIYVINRGPTKADRYAALKLEAGTSETLGALARELQRHQVVGVDDGPVQLVG